MKRFVDLPEHVQNFLIDLREEEIEELKEAIEFHRDVKRFGRWTKWALVSIVSAFLAAIAIGDGIGKVILWWRSGR